MSKKLAVSLLLLMLGLASWDAVVPDPTATDDDVHATGDGTPFVP